MGCAFGHITNSIEAGSLQGLGGLVDTIGILLAATALEDEAHLVFVLDVLGLVHTTAEQAVVAEHFGTAQGVQTFRGQRQPQHKGKRPHGQNDSQIWRQGGGNQIQAQFPEEHQLRCTVHGQKRYAQARQRVPQGPWPQQGIEQIALKENDGKIEMGRK